MSKKLTLNVDDDLISFAHDYSKNVGLSISKLFEQYLLKLKSLNNKEKLNKQTQALYGLFSNMPIPEKNVLRKEFHEKGTN
jgi:hypothetical protein